MVQMNHYELDVRNQLCPIPVIRTQNRVKTLSANDTLTITATDPGVLQDIPAWCRVHGHKLISTAIEGKEFLIKIEVVRKN